MKNLNLFFIFSFLICLIHIDCSKKCSTLHKYVHRFIFKNKVCTDYTYDYYGASGVLHAKSYVENAMENPFR